MGIDKNLYRVTCCCSRGGWFSISSLEVFVIASDTKEAEEKALSKMRELNYIYASFVSKIELLASDDKDKNDLLII